jgi:glycosyltransferase involved in cell wall biosynthesis
LITFIGRLDEQKGLPWLFELLPTVFTRLPNHDLLVVGSGPQRALLERLAADRGLANRVHFAGFRDEVAAILAASDLLVLPSRWEGMPNVLLEAMASGKPVVATAVEGVVELLSYPLASMQVLEVDDSQGFANKVVAIIQDSVWAAQLGQLNRARAAKEFSFNAMVAAYERLYDSLLGDRD